MIGGAAAGVLRSRAVRGTTRIRARFAARALALTLLVAVACAGERGDSGRAGGAGEAAAGGTGAAASPTARTYTVRAQVTRLPEPGQAPVSLWLRHEAIHDFVGRDGKVTGMDAMAMPFDLAEGVALDGIEAGDIVEFTLVVDWEAEDPVHVTAVRELPPDTKLVFAAAEPPRG